MTTYQAQITHLPGQSAPDEYDPSRGLYPPDDFVVSRDAEGNTLSTYGDLFWNRSPYGVRASDSMLYFDYWRARYATPDMQAAKVELTPQRAALVREIRWLMFVVMYLRPGNGLSNSTLGRYCDTLCSLALKAESLLTSIERLLGDADVLVDLAKSSADMATTLAALLKLLKWLGPGQVGFTVVADDKIGEIREIALDRADGFDQTPPLPTRIYSRILSALAAEINDFEGIVDRLLAILAGCAKDPFLGRDRKIQYGKKARVWQLRPEFPELLQQYGLEEFWAIKGYKPWFSSLSKALTEIMAVCLLRIQAFTGMRRNEAEALPHYCLEEVTTNGEVHYIVRGRVTKLTGGKPKRARWVTSESGRRAVLLAQRISKAIYTLAGDVPQDEESHLDAHYLFISPAYCLLRDSQEKHQPASIHLSNSSLVRLRGLLEIPITEADLNELDLIDPERHWRDEEEFQVGRPWVFGTHQLRRSLALYAHASGIVSIPSLKRQLQHLTREMSLYYSRGSTFAKNFIVRSKANEKHIGEEWRDTEPEAQYLGHKLNVEMGNPDEMAGAYSLWFDRNIRAKQVSLDREATLKEFQQGKRAYRETFAGGCTKVGACDKRMDDPLNLECLLNECRHLVIKLPKFERIIRIQISAVEDLNKTAPDLPETRAEQEILDRLLERKEAILQAKAKSAEGQQQ